jgi:DNA-binding GntR family transcriptional regulator
MDKIKIRELSQNFSSLHPVSVMVATTLREAILAGMLAPDEKITEEIIAELFSVSRTPVREAIREIEKEGLIITLPRIGTVVKHWDFQDFIDLYKVASALEGLAARLAAESRIPQGSAMLMKNLIEKIKESDMERDRLAFEQYNYEFHMTIARCTGNTYLEEATDMILSKIRLVRPCVFPSLPYNTAQFQTIYKAHTQIYEAILSGDVTAAEKFAKEHISQAIDWGIELINKKKDVLT